MHRSNAGRNPTPFSQASRTSADHATDNLRYTRPVPTDPILDPLNAVQRQAVLHTDGPTFILAGAGSGKTRALTHRIAHLLRTGVKPWEILAVTFTNKAATEMKERIRNLLHIAEGEDPAPVGSHAGRLPVMGTFHGICARILRRDIEHLGRDRSFVIYDSDDQERLMKTILKDMHIDESELKPRAALSYVGRFKSEALSPKEAAADATTERMQRIVEAYAAYQTALRTHNAVDFDDLLLETVRLFREVPDVLERYRQTWKYLHVDEYQDTNHAQYLFITLLAQGHRNLCVIGDPDQSIYAFRGADIRNILEFQKDYPDAARFTLDQNYRSTQPILTAADAVIAANPHRPAKTMWTERREGPKVTVHEFRDERAEADEVLHLAERLRAQGVRWNDQVVLYRTNAQSRLFEEAALRRGIPYRIVGGVTFYARREVKDVLAYLHVLLNPYDTLSLLRIINVPSRKIGETTLRRLQEACAKRNARLWDILCDIPSVDSIPAPARERLAALVTLLREGQERANILVVGELTEWLLERICMRSWLEDGTEEGQERWDNVQELLSVMRKYHALEPNMSLLSFLEEASLVAAVDHLATAQDDAVTFMTLHLCKGLEFEAVTIAGCEEGIFPHSSAMFDHEQLEEERRLLYVGMTRAKTHLTLTLARSRILHGDVRSNPPSRFLDDLPPDVTERRSDNVLSAFAWAAQRRTEGRPEEETMEDDTLHIEFNQDLAFAAERHRSLEKMRTGTRVHHPVFGTGTVHSRRGDVATIRFDTGEERTFALNIAPLTIL